MMMSYYCPEVELERDLLDYYSRHHHFACFTEPFTVRDSKSLSSE